METSQKTMKMEIDGRRKAEKREEKRRLGFVWFLCLSTFPSA
jgi:hypothetical protein